MQADSHEFARINISVPVASLVVFLLSFLLVRLIQSIPLFKYIVP